MHTNEQLRSVLSSSLSDVRGYSPNPYTIPEGLLIKIIRTLNVNRKSELIL